VKPTARRILYCDPNCYLDHFNSAAIACREVMGGRDAGVCRGSLDQGDGGSGD